MSIYRWRDPTKHYATREYVWERHYDGRITVDAPAKGRSPKWPDQHMEWTWPQWAEIATCAGTYFEKGRVYQFKSDGCYVAFGWEKKARQEFPEVMHIRGVWDHAEILPIEMPAQHWADVLGCLDIEPPMLGKPDRMSLLLDIPVAEPPKEEPRRNQGQKEPTVLLSDGAGSISLESVERLRRMWESTPDVARSSD